MAEFPLEVPVGNIIYVVLRRRQGLLEIECRVAWTARAGRVIRHGLAFLTPQPPAVAEELFLDSER